jgi:aspartyl-tRNA(Asn)/glutamyl-tRNA(Gln) amidotransferase subunit C
MFNFYLSLCYNMMIMAKLKRDDILKLAHLARLDLTEQEIAEFTDELSEILQYVEQLQSVDIAGLQPTNQVTGLTNVTRKDEPIDYGYTAKDLLKNVPVVQDDLIKVKRIIG